jgi:hypothetical protein
VGNAAVPVSDAKKGRPCVHEMVRVRDQHGLYQVRGIDRRNRTVHVTRNLLKNPIKKDVPFEAICRLEKHMALIIDRFLNS